MGREKKMSQVRARLIAAPTVLLVLGGVLYLHHASGNDLGTHLVLAAFAAVGGIEMSRLFKAAGFGSAPREAGVCCGILCGLGILAGLDGIVASHFLLVVLTTALIFLWIMLRFLTDTRPEAVAEIACRMIPILYVGLLLTFTANIALGPRGALNVLYLVLVSKASDMAGWAIGLPFGKHKMIPSVSPGKSWEGTIGGLAASVLVAVFLPSLFWGESVTQYGLSNALLGLLIGAASILAGVTWSGWKRRLDAKDSSDLIPGLGGVMDMVDSLLLAGPAAYLFQLLANLFR